MKIGTHSFEEFSSKDYEFYKEACINRSYFKCVNCGLVVFGPGPRFLVSSISNYTMISAVECNCDEVLMKEALE